MTEHEMKFQGKEKADKYMNGAIRDKAKGKGAYELISPYAEEELSIVYEKGAEQKGARNWENGIPISRLVQSAKRHINQYQQGLEDENHIAHAIWNLYAILHNHRMIKMGILPPEIDDMPKYEQRKTE